MALMSITEDVFQPPMSMLNAFVPENMALVFVTAVVFHLLMFLLNVAWLVNKLYMSLTKDVSQSSICR